MLLARLWDKINAGMRRNVPAYTAFLSPREQEMARYLFGNAQGVHFFGGYTQAERKTLCYLPEYLDEEALFGSDGPIACLHATFYEGDAPTHRDFLGGLMACGIERDVVGDILVGKGQCDFFVTAQMADFLCRTLVSVGRTKLKLSPIPLSQVHIAPTVYAVICDTVASARLDSILAVGFRISRSAAEQRITAGKVAVDGLPCEKPDKPITEGMRISVRGLGKIQVHSVNGQTKKGRIRVTIHRYL